MSAPVIPDDPHDEALLAQVRPPDWVNPTPRGRYNLVVVGAGTAGLVSAAGTAILGGKAALVERALLGGDCLNTGCVPSKALLRSARAAAEVRRGHQHGVRVPETVLVDFPSVMERMRRLRAQFAPHDSAGRFRGLGVDVYLGQGTFTGPDALTVGGQALNFSRALIATGARPRKPDIPGLEEAGYQTSETVFTLTHLPTRLAVIGAGPIGCELAQAFARFGSQVTLLNNHNRILAKEEFEAAHRVENALHHDGVTVRHGVIVTAARREGEKRILTLRGGEELTVDQVLVGVGRQPNVEGLGLEAAGVQFDPHTGVTVNDFLRTSNRRIYAAGDVCSRYQFTHAADAMARLALRNALFWGRGRISRLIVPRCTYTDPEVASVGLTREEAGQQGVKVRSFLQELSGVDRAVLDGEAEGYVRVLVREGSDQVVGATVVAAHAGEMIGLLTLAVAQGIGLGRLAGLILPYPTQAEAVRKIADAYNRTRLRPWVKGLLRRWLNWGR